MTKHIVAPLFPLGQIVATPGAVVEMANANQEAKYFIGLHLRLDKGCLDASDHAQNKLALKLGNRIFSAFKTNLGAKLWVITEADRSSTCILLPEEY